jgi:hypothetical protein
LRATRKQVAALKIDELLDHSRIRSSLRLLAFLFVPVMATVIFNPSWVGGTLNMLANPLDHLPPSQTTIEVEPKGLRVVRGSPVTIQASTAGALPQSLELITWQGSNAKGELIGQEKVAMENLGGGKFSSKIARLEKTLRYRVVTGAFTSATFTAEAVDTPEIANVQLMLYPPAYTGLASVYRRRAASKG